MRQSVMMQIRSLPLARMIAVVAAVLMAQAMVVTPADAGKARYYTGLVSGVAVGGYDPVAYFTAKKAVRGSKEFETEWDGVKWRFSSAENRDAFVKSPTSFAPQYGGYCAYAVGIGQTAKGDPRQWKVVDGKLYLNYNRSIKSRWERKQSYYIKSGDKNWPKLSR